MYGISCYLQHPSEPIPVIIIFMVSYGVQLFYTAQGHPCKLQHSKWILIGIINMVDSPEKVLMPRWIWRICHWYSRDRFYMIWFDLIWNIGYHSMLPILKHLGIIVEKWISGSSESLGLNTQFCGGFFNHPYKSVNGLWSSDPYTEINLMIK